jgi:hypothetical protein
VSILLDALDITNLDTNGLLFEFRDGQPSRIPTYRGTDDVIPQASGMYAGQWTADTRELRLYGVVIGTGATSALQQAVTISTTGEFGAASASLTSCRPMRIVTEFEFAAIYWQGFLEFTCIKSPPNWAVTP